MIYEVEMIEEHPFYPRLTLQAETLDEYHKLEQIWSDISTAQDTPDDDCPDIKLDRGARTLSLSIHCARVKR